VTLTTRSRSRRNTLLLDLYLARRLCSSLDVSGGSDEHAIQWDGSRMFRQHVKPSVGYVLYYCLCLDWSRLQSPELVLSLPLFSVAHSSWEAFV
ncbi:hypothetical protein COCON_G00056440, partial [Conger conger]